jgi:MoaA/NifB/PqqE/SkfB family radical SAM enzyme
MNIRTVRLYLTNYKTDNYKDDPFFFSEEIREFDFDVAAWLLREAKKNGATSLYLSGGEPLEYSRINDLLEEAKKLDYSISLETSGKLFLRDYIWLKKLGVTNITIPFFGSSSEVHDFIRGRNSFQKNVAATEVAKNFGFTLRIKYIFGRHNAFQADESINFITSFQAHTYILEEIPPFGRALENHLELNRSEAYCYYQKIKAGLERTRIPFHFNYGNPPYPGSWICGSLEKREISCNWKNQTSYCPNILNGNYGNYEINKNELDEKQFQLIYRNAEEKIDSFREKNQDLIGGCEKCLAGCKKMNPGLKNSEEKSILYTFSESPKNDNINTLEIDLTNIGKTNDLFYQEKYKKYINVDELLSFIDNVSEKWPLRNVLFRGMGDPINHSEFLRVVEYISGQKKSISLFVFPDQIKKYTEKLGTLQSSVSLNCYHYPDKYYEKTLSKLDEYKSKLAGHFFIVDCQTHDHVDTFLEYASKNNFHPYFIRAMNKNNPFDFLLKRKIENIISKRKYHKNIFWENGRDFGCQCSYQRGQRVFINSSGNISFCHFLPQHQYPGLKLSEAAKNTGLVQKIYSDYRKNKEVLCQRRDYCFEIENPSPCDYCDLYLEKIIKNINAIL